MSSPVIVIGAPRSGTNMLRDVLCRVPGLGTWPCDEVNYIWRHGNVRYPSDEFTSDMARPNVRRYIQKKFAVQQKMHRVVVEKTCANTLRVPFVDKVVPDARYVFIVRDGIDAVGSAMKRWTAKLDVPYVARKVRYVPISDLPYYGSRYFMNRVYRVFSQSNRLAFWGPQLDNMPELLQKHSLDEVCALQWKRCVDSSYDAFQNTVGDRAIWVRYEEFVAQPAETLKRILDFLDEDSHDDILSAATSSVRVTSLGKGRGEIDQSVTDRLLPLIASTMQTHGYE